MYKINVRKANKFSERGIIALKNGNIYVIITDKDILYIIPLA